MQLFCTFIYGFVLFSHIFVNEFKLNFKKHFNVASFTKQYFINREMSIKGVNKDVNKINERLEETTN